ncbi:MAG: multidrug efflux RND transporter permease subunit [Muribaculaceae bacterium]|nr:multidrug efflux RND transporter permease subunit [Muribaculaceae bacterium]
MFSNFFIKRPIFATVLAVLMVLAGIMTMRTLPVSQYPDITPPTVMVSASYPGANATTVAKAIGVPIEQQINGVENMLYMSSTSSDDGSYNLTITFENGTDVDQAAIDVQNRMNMAQAQLPTAVTEQGINVNKESSNQVLFVALRSDDPKRYDALYLTNYAQLNIVDPLSRVEGVGGVDAFGSGEYSMRVWLDPYKMRIRNLTPEDVENAIRAQNMEVSAGSVGAAPNADNGDFSYTIVVNGQLTSAEEFGNIILRTDGNGILRLNDVAKVELGSSSYSVVSKINGEETALIGIRQLPGANALDVAKGSIKELDRLSQYFPEGVNYQVVMNSTDYVSKSIDEVLVTFVETSLIVMLVILIFLQNWRAVIIPMLTIPVSLIATFAVMKILGFSINTLTLFGLVLAIAIVVDDAIVVVEDCSRLVDEGKLNRIQAAEQAMKELTGPVVGEVLVLLSVFIPTAFVSGITGSLYKQFALTIAVSTAFSGFNALTLTPALCALFLKPRKPAKFFLYRWFNAGWAKVEALYDRTVGKMLKHAKLSLLVYLAIAGVAFWGFTSWPTSYIPEEDMGYFMTSIQLPTGASLERTEEFADQLSASILKDVPGVKDVMSVAGTSFMGGSGSNSASFFVMLKPWSERKGKDMSIDAIIQKVNEISAKFPEAITFSLNPPAIPGLGMTSGLEMQLLDINNLGSAELAKALDEVKTAAAKDNRIASVTTTYQGEVPQYQLVFDRDRAMMQGISIDDINSTLSAYLGDSYVNDFFDFGRSFQVTVKGNPASRADIEDIHRLSVRNADGEMVPFSTFTKIEQVMGTPTVNRYNMYQTASLTASPAKGVSSSEGIAAMEEIVKDTLGKNYGYAWTGQAYQETQSGVTISFVFIFAIIMTILVLAAQYESWTDPIAVVLSMPVAILGTILGCLVMNQSISIYTQIGLILLLGMSAKNAILIVEYAMDFRKAGAPILKAAQEAGQIRFRPIMMTALAFVFGVMPMMFATGPGANSRIEIGTAVVFGMAMNAFIGTLFVPNFWVLMQTIQEKYLSKIIKPPKNLLKQSSSASQQAQNSDTI